MQYQGSPLVGNYQIVNMIPPTTSATASSNLASDVVALKKYFASDNVITFSTHSIADVLTVYKSSDLTNNSTQPIPFVYYTSTQASVDTLSTGQLATSTGISLGTVDNGIVIFRVTQEDLTSTSGVSATTDLKFANYYFTLTGSTAHSVAATAYLSGSRYVRQPMPTAIA